MSNQSAEPTATAVSSVASASIPGQSFKEISNTLKGAEQILESGSLGNELRDRLKKASDNQQQQQSQPAEKVIPVEGVKRAAEAASDQPRQAGSALEDLRQEGVKKTNDKRRARNDAIKQEKQEAEDRKDDKPAPARDEKPAASEADAAEKKEDNPITMEEVEKELSNPAISNRHRERMKFLHSQAKRAQELEEKIKGLEAKSSSSTSTEEFKGLQEKLEKTNRELLQYRRRLSLENDPEIKARFDDVIASSEKAISEKLKAVGLPDATLKVIEDSGGFSEFSRSNKVFTINVKDPDTGEMVPRQVTAAQLSRQWLDAMPVADSRYIDAKLIEKFNLQDQKDREIKKLSSEAEKYFHELEEQQKQAETQFKGQVEEKINDYNKRAEQWIAKQPWLATVPENPAEGEAAIQKAKDHNKFVEGVKALIKNGANVSSVDDYFALVEQAATGVHLRREVDAIKRENEALKKRLEGANAGARTTGGPRSSSINTPAPKPTGVKDTMKTSALSSIQESMERLRLGQPITDEE